MIQTKQKRAAREQRNKHKPRTEARTTPSNQTRRQAGGLLEAVVYKVIFQQTGQLLADSQAIFNTLPFSRALDVISVVVVGSLFYICFTDLQPRLKSNQELVCRIRE